MLSVNLQNMFITIEEIHSYSSRSRRKRTFYVNGCKKKNVLMSVSIIGLKLLNQLDANVRNVKTINILGT